ncbi:DNA repair protein [Kiritimatiellota bacterium B12222]|nr:DNA repair protein [Kiritimatiellota bacterium B12222]
MTENIPLIKTGLKLGELHAEADEVMLQNCFIDNGIYSEITDTNSQQSIIVGRTGSGKSAIIYKIKLSQEHTSFIDPNDISARFLENSNIIQFFHQLGIKIDLFYKVLWSHILTVELLKLRYNIKSLEDNRSFISKLNGWVQRNSVKQRALEYFYEWGNSFWLETHEQLKELTSKFENNIKGSLGTKYANLDLSLEGAKSLNEESRSEIIRIANQVVSKIQLQDLKKVQDLLAENAFDDPQKKYFLLIDQLDEDWAETDTRCKFIRALIEETKDFRRIPNVKIVTAIRKDLLDLVFDKTRGAGFQEEKYEAYIYNISWVRKNITELLNTRVKQVYKMKYTKDTVRFSDVFPKPQKHENITAIDFIIERTLFRPRDAIQFANECFAGSTGKGRITWRALRSAETKYSLKRLKSLSEEWQEIYPALNQTIEILRGLPTPFVKSNISSDSVHELACNLHELDHSDPCVQTAVRLYDTNAGIKESDLVNIVLSCLYRIGAIGIKISSSMPISWSHIDAPILQKSEIKRVNSIHVHKMLHNALEIKINS